MNRVVSRAFALVAILVALASAGVAPAAERVRVEDLDVAREGDTVVVGYRLAGSIPDDVVERLDAGFAVTFRHRVELVLRRSYWLTPSRLLHRCEIETTATYDSLTKQYRLERVTRHDVPDEEPIPETVESATTASVDEVRDWLTELDDVALPADGLDDAPGRRGRVRVSSVLGRRYVLFVFPSAISASAEADLES